MCAGGEPSGHSWTSLELGEHLFMAGYRSEELWNLD